MCLNIWKLSFEFSKNKFDFFSFWFFRDMNFGFYFQWFGICILDIVCACLLKVFFKRSVPGRTLTEIMIWVMPDVGIIFRGPVENITYMYICPLPLEIWDLGVTWPVWKLKFTVIFWAFFGYQHIQKFGRVWLNSYFDFLKFHNTKKSYLRLRQATPLCRKGPQVLALRSNEVKT